MPAPIATADIRYTLMAGLIAQARVGIWQSLDEIFATVTLTDAEREYLAADEELIESMRV